MWDGLYLSIASGPTSSASSDLKCEAKRSKLILDHINVKKREHVELKNESFSKKDISHLLNNF